MEDPLHLNIERPQVLYRQITQQVRSLILKGQLAPGDKLPPTSELATKWKTHAGTVHAALRPLVKEGLLTRSPKVGTFVAKRGSGLTAIAIYFDSDIWAHEANAFKRAVHAELSRLLKQSKIESEVWIDSRRESQRGKRWPELVAAVEQRKFQAILATDVPESVINWIQQLAVPSAFFTTSECSASTRVEFDFNQFIESSIAILKRQGCKSVGMISIIEPFKRRAPKGKSAQSDNQESFRQHFFAACKMQGIDVRCEWTRMAHRFIRDESQEEFGYNEMNSIWDLPKRPDGLVVFPDTSVPGVITAALERRIDVPGDLKLVVHKHVEIDFLCPLKVSFIYSNAKEIASALLEQIKRHFRGEVCVPIVVPFRLKAGAGRR